MKKNFWFVLGAFSILTLVQSASYAGGCPGNCNAHGVCDGGTNTCTCNVGFAGPGCDQCAPDFYNYPVCVFCQSATTCSGNGTCGPTGTCNCNAGFSGVNCENGPPPVPTVSEWGLAVLTLTGLIAGAKLFSRRTQST